MAVISVKSYSSYSPPEEKTYEEVKKISRKLEFLKTPNLKEKFTKILLSVMKSFRKKQDATPEPKSSNELVQQLNKVYI